MKKIILTVLLLSTSIMTVSYARLSKKALADLMISMDTANRLEGGYFYKVAPRSSYKKTFNCIFDVEKKPSKVLGCTRCIRYVFPCCYEYIINDFYTCHLMTETFVKVFDNIYN